MIKMVLLDFDGVIGNSLSPHVKFCHDMAKRYGLDLNLPECENGRLIASTPMDNFLRRAKFPEDLIPVILRDHYVSFGNDYVVDLFVGMDNILRKLYIQGLQLGIVSSNNLANIQLSLKDLCSIFNLIITSEDHLSKSDGINRIINKLAINKNEVVFIGDTNKDYEAAQKSGVSFIGVSYGWEINSDDPRFIVVNNAQDLLQKILSLM